MEVAANLRAAVVRFGAFEADLRARQLRKHGVKVKLADQSFRILAALLERGGEVVSREELRSVLWPDSLYGDFESSINTAVLKLRHALSDSHDRSVFIETLPKRGYRFIAPYSQRSAPQPRLIVLPFLNLTGDPGQEYLADALTEELTGTLAQASPGDLSVIARTSAMHYRRCGKSITRIGRDLNVDYVVESSFRAGDSDAQLIANIQLIRVRDEAHVWAGRCELDAGRLFVAVNNAASGIIAYFGVAAYRQRSRTTTDDTAYNMYARGRFEMFHASPTNWSSVKEWFERAVARDRRFAPAYVALGELHWHAGFFGWIRPVEACAAGMLCAARALEIDNTLGEAHALVGMFRLNLEFNWPEVHREMETALRLAPDSPLVKMWYAIGDCIPAGRLDDAAAALESALEIDPLNPVVRAWLLMVHWLAGENERACEQARVLLEVHPDSYFSPFAAGVIYREQGLFTEAIALHRQAVQLSAGAPITLIWLGLALAQAGEMTEARATLDRLLVMARETYIPSTGIAWNCLALGDVDAAFCWLNRAIDERDYMMAAIRHYPQLAPVRSDPRFLALLRRMNLES